MRWYFLALLALAWLMPGSLTHGRAEPNPAPQPPKTFDLAAIDAYVAGQVRDKNYVGMSLAILRDGKIIFAKGYGKRCLDPAAAVTADTPFSTGSVCKQFTCACILLLAEDGKLSVRDSVAKYYPDLTRARDVTLYDLMTHVSGYPDYFPLDFPDRRMLKPIDRDKLIADYAGGKLDFEPGARWSYSNTGYIILGRVVEKVSGEPFGKFLEQRILKPLKMEQSHFEPGADVEGLARGYTSFALSPPEAANREAAGWIHSAAGLYASASDLARWDLALSEGKVLKPESYRLMTTMRRLSNGKTADYGCGLDIALRDGETILKHSGSVSGFSAYNAIVPRTRSAVVLLANVDNLDPGPLHGEILTLLLQDQAERDEGAGAPRVRGPAPEEAALDLFQQLQAGAVKRERLGAEFNSYLSDERVQAAAVRLKGLGEPQKTEVSQFSERGGMEFSEIRFTFKTGVLIGRMFRSVDGKICCKSLSVTP